jgi:hypothetical protein
VDAAALSGAAAIPNYNTSTDPNTVYSMVSGLNASNTVMHLDGSNTVMIQSAELSGSNVEFCTGLPDSPTCTSATIPADGVRVTKPYTAPLYFGKLFKNGDTADLTVSAIAWLGGPASYNGDLPIALCAQDMGYNPGTGEVESYTCSNEPVSLTPNISDNAGWWTPEGITANANDCRRLVNDSTLIETTSVDETINLNNGELTTCLKAVENRFAGTCFEPATEVINPDGTSTWIRGTDGVRCPGTLTYDSSTTAAQTEECTVTLPVVDCPNSINQQQPIIGYASVCIYYVQANPASVATVTGTVQCNVTVDAPGGGPTLGTYASRPVLVK